MRYPPDGHGSLCSAQATIFEARLRRDAAGDGRGQLTLLSAGAAVGGPSAGCGSRLTGGAVFAGSDDPG